MSVPLTFPMSPHIPAPPAPRAVDAVLDPCLREKGIRSAGLARAGREWTRDLKPRQAASTAITKRDAVSEPTTLAAITLAAITPTPPPSSSPSSLSPPPSPLPSPRPLSLAPPRSPSPWLPTRPHLRRLPPPPSLSPPGPPLLSSPPSVPAFLNTPTPDAASSPDGRWLATRASSTSW